MKITKANFLSRVKGSASDAIQKGEKVSYDLDDANTRQYVAGLLNKVKEAAGADTNWSDLFKWTTEDFCESLVDITFPEVSESSADIGLKPDQVDDMVSKLADDANSIESLMSSMESDTTLLDRLELVAESTEEETPEGTETVTETT